MNFQNAYITTAGQEFLTRAVSGTKIHWDKCGCYTQNLNSATQEQINALTDLTGLVALGSASAVFDGEEGAAGLARITCQVDNSQPGCTAGSAYSFGIWARLENARGAIDIKPTLIAVARVGTNAPTYFPTYTDATTRLLGVIDLAITVQSGAASTISVTTSGFALASNLQTEIDAREALASRVVTTHSATSTTTGEDQVILGTKRFRNSAYFKYSHHECIYTDDLGVDNADYINLYSDILPDSNDLRLGSTSRKFNDINTEYIHAETVNTNACATTDLFTNTIDTKTGNNITLRKNIIPDTDNGYTLGDGLFQFKEGWFGDVYTNQLTAYTRITCDSYLPLNTSGSSLGSSTSKFDTAYIKNIDVTTLSPMGTDTIMMNGDVDIAHDIYIEGGITVDGGITSGGPLTASFINNTILPNINRTTTATVMNQVDVGAIILLYVRSTYASQQEIPPGYVLDGSNQYLSFGFAKATFGTGSLDGTLVFSLYNSTTESVGKFKTLSACTIPANGSGIVLAMRIQ